MAKVYTPEQQSAIDKHKSLVAQIGACSRLISEVSARYSSLIADNIATNDELRHLSLGGNDVTQPSEIDIANQIGNLLCDLNDRFTTTSVVELPQVNLPAAS